jgi:lipoprotein-releasing system permease protein
MRNKLIITISIALMRARLKQTLVAAVGVTFGITMFITLLGFMNGLNDMLDGLILNRTPHIRLYNEVKATEKQPALGFSDWLVLHSVKPANARTAIYNSGAILNRIKADDRVYGVAPKLTTQVFYNVGSIDITGIINGIDVIEENRLFNFNDYVTSGNFIDLKNVSNSIILGKGAADKMLAKIGDVIQVTTAGGERMMLKVVGYYQSGLADFDKVQSFASITTVQKLMGKTNSYITDIQIKLYDLALAPSVAKEYALLFDTDAEDIQTANAQFETGTKVRNIISYAVGITLLIVAGFGIYNILNMMIYEKMDTIAILKATGFSGTDVRNIFMFIALSIGIVGGFAGLGFGLLSSFIIDNLPFRTTALPTITTFPVNYHLKFYIIGIVFSLVTTWMAGYFPAKKASSIDPVIIIRGN